MSKGQKGSSREQWWEIDRDVLVDALKRVQPAVPASHVVDAFTWLEMRHEEGGLVWLQGQTETAAIAVNVWAATDRDGALATTVRPDHVVGVGMARLSAAVGGMKAGRVRLTYEEGGKAMVVSSVAQGLARQGKTQARIPLERADDLPTYYTGNIVDAVSRIACIYPEPPEGVGEGESGGALKKPSPLVFRASAQEVVLMLKQVYTSIGTDESRPLYCAGWLSCCSMDEGVYAVQPKGEGPQRLAMGATNTARIAWAPLHTLTPLDISDETRASAAWGDFVGKGVLLQRPALQMVQALLQQHAAMMRKQESDEVAIVLGSYVPPPEVQRAIREREKSRVAAGGPASPASPQPPSNHFATAGAGYAGEENAVVSVVTVHPSPAQAGANTPDNNPDNTDEGETAQDWTATVLVCRTVPGTFPLASRPGLRCVPESARQLVVNAEDLQESLKAALDCRGKGDMVRLAAADNVLTVAIQIPTAEYESTLMVDYPDKEPLELHINARMVLDTLSLLKKAGAVSLHVTGPTSPVLLTCSLAPGCVWLIMPSTGE